MWSLRITSKRNEAMDFNTCSLLAKDIKHKAARQDYRPRSNSLRFIVGLPAFHLSVFCIKIRG